MPKVSICIPTYKQIEYLRKTLDSIQIQDFEDYEIIITDDSPNISVKSLVDSYDFQGKLKYYKNTQPLGSPENWNEAVRKASGEFIKIMHHDDYFTYPYSLRRYFEMVENSKLSFAFSAAVVIMVRDKKTWIHSASEKQIKNLKDDPRALFFGNFVGSPSATIYRKEFIEYDRNLKWVVDFDFYIQYLLKAKTFGYTLEPLITTIGAEAHSVTNECIDNREVQVFEYTYLFNKIYHFGVLAPKKFYSYFENLFSQYNVRSISDIRAVGYRGPLPFQIILLLYKYNFMSFVSITKKIVRKIFPKADETAEKRFIPSWKKPVHPLPPHHSVKQKLIKDAKDKYQCNILIETGTYLGEMIDAQLHEFNRIYSIELGPDLYKNAVEKFKTHKHVTILFGDSGKVLNTLMPQIQQPAIFWLDGHYSEGITAKGEKECPIYEELAAIFANRPFTHVLLIDDARLFIGKNDYPTLDELSSYIKSFRPSAEIFVRHDTIHVICK